MSKISSLLAAIAPPDAVAGQRPMRKPASLVYGSDEKPPIAITIVSAIQHVGVIAIFMIYPLIIARTAGAGPDEIGIILRRAMLVLAVAVLLQALPRGPVGSRFLAPAIFTGVYLGPSLLAVKLGGLPLVWGMTLFAGFVEVALSRVWSRLRVFIPPETAGMVVFLVGVIIGLAALRIMLDEFRRAHGLGPWRARRRPEHRDDDRPQHLEQGTASAFLHFGGNVGRLWPLGLCRLHHRCRCAKSVERTDPRLSVLFESQLDILLVDGDPFCRHRLGSGHERHRRRDDLSADQRCRLGAS